MDDIADYFGEDAVDAMVQNLNIAEDSDDYKRQFAQDLMASEEMLLQALLGPNAEQDIKEGKADNLTLPQVVEILHTSELADMLYPKGKFILQAMIMENKPMAVYSKEDLADVARILIKLSP